MYQNYPNFYQPRQTVPQQQQIQAQQLQQIQQLPSFLKGRLVASIEEVRATPIDFDGSVFFFPDLANKKIYTKQINLDGTASMNMYELKEMPVPVAQTNSIDNNNSYITRSEFDTAMSKIQSMISQRIATEAPKEQPAINNAITATPSQEEVKFNF